MPALPRFARILKQPMISCSSFGKPAKYINTKSCLQTATYKYPEKRFKQTESTGIQNIYFYMILTVFFSGFNNMDSTSSSVDSDEST